MLTNFQLFVTFLLLICYLKGGAKKTSLNSQHRFCLISLTKNILEGWDMIHWKGGIHSFVWSTKTFLYNIWEPRYKQTKISRFQNVWIFDNLSVLKSDVPYCFTFISASLYLQKCVWTFSMPNKYIIFKMGYVPAF